MGRQRGEGTGPRWPRARRGRARPHGGAVQAASRRASLLVPLRFLLVRAYSSIRVQLIWRKVGSGTRRSFAWQGPRHGGAGGVSPALRSLLSFANGRPPEPGAGAWRVRRAPGTPCVPGLAPCTAVTGRPDPRGHGGFAIPALTRLDFRGKWEFIRAIEGRWVCTKV